MCNSHLEYGHSASSPNRRLWLLFKYIVLALSVDPLFGLALGWLVNFHSVVWRIMNTLRYDRRNSPLFWMSVLHVPSPSFMTMISQLPPLLMFNERTLRMSRTPFLWSLIGCRLCLLPFCLGAAAHLWRFLHQRFLFFFQLPCSNTPLLMPLERNLCMGSFPAWSLAALAPLSC